MTNPTENTAPRREQFGPFQLVIVALSVYVLVALLVESLVALPADVRVLLQRIDDAICFVFLADFFVRLARSDDRLKFMRWGWIDLLSSIPTIDFLRWGRLVRIVRVFRILRAFRSTRVLVAYFFRNRALGTFAAVALISITLTIFASIAILTFENVPEANIKSGPDALWWSFVTITTVGYGDRYPVTPGGRMIAAILMTAGVGLFGTFTGFVASFFVEPEQQREEAQDEVVMAELRAIREELAALRAASVPPER